MFVELSPFPDKAPHEGRCRLFWRLVASVELAGVAVSFSTASWVGVLCHPSAWLPGGLGPLHACVRGNYTQNKGTCGALAGHHVLL